MPPCSHLAAKSHYSRVLVPCFVRPRSHGCMSDFLLVHMPAITGVLRRPTHAARVLPLDRFSYSTFFLFVYGKPIAEPILLLSGGLHKSVFRLLDPGCTLRNYRLHFFQLARQAPCAHQSDPARCETQAFFFGTCSVCYCPGSRSS